MQPSPPPRTASPQERDTLRRAIMSPPTVDKVDSLSGRMALAQQAGRVGDLELANTRLQLKVPDEAVAQP